MRHRYTVTEWEHGIHVTAPVPMTALWAICEAAEKAGHTHLLGSVSAVLGGGFTLGDPARAADWLAEIEAARPGEVPP